MITVTKAFLPPAEDYQRYLQRIWASGQLTNHGPLVGELKERLQSFLGVDDLVLTNNGTSPLQIAVHAFAAGGEVITTPFSYIATSAAIAWQGSTPVFVDIDPDYLTIDETKIEQAITSRTRAILATHVFGNPCHIEAIEQIGRTRGLPVIFDAAHCFGVNWRGRSIFACGDVSTCSFHATKIFHTGEGGALFARSHAVLQQLRPAANFGHDGYYGFSGLGINAKMSELHAAMGLSVLPHFPAILTRRREVYETYLEHLDLARATPVRLRDRAGWNYSYVPVLLPDAARTEATLRALEAEGILARRYFHPSLNTLPFLNARPMPVSEDVAGRILCLPTHHELTGAEILRVCETVNRVLRPSSVPRP